MVCAQADALRPKLNFTVPEMFLHVGLGSTPVIENFEPNFREGSGSGNSNRHHLALTSHEQRRPSLQRQDDPLTVRENR